VSQSLVAREALAGVHVEQLGDQVLGLR
jgi:hypothetical protein